MTLPDDSVTPPWKAPPSSKVKNAVQRAVTALLDELAPERVLKRSEALHVPVEQHRTPTGCVLQAPKAAVSVSWFSGAGNDPVLGELRIMVWQGVVSRRGAPRQRVGASMITEMVLHPVEHGSGGLVWRVTDGSEYDTPALATLCTKLLDQQVAKAG